MLFFSAVDVSRATTIPAHFMHTCTFHFSHRISIFYFSNGKIASPMNHMELANVPNPVGFMKVLAYM